MQSDPTNSSTTVRNIIEAAPAAGAVTIGILELPLDWWLKVGGLAFLGLQMGYLLWRWWTERSDRKEKRNQIKAGLSD